MTLRLVKLGYSSKPWRLVDQEGFEVGRMVPYPGHTEHDMPPVWAPLAWETKTEGIEALCEMAASHLATQRELKAYCAALRDHYADASVRGGVLGRVLTAAALRSPEGGER